MRNRPRRKLPKLSRKARKRLMSAGRILIHVLVVVLRMAVE